MQLSFSDGPRVHIIQTKDRNVSIFVTACDFGLLLWASGEEFLGLEMAAAVVDFGLRITPLFGQWMDSGPDVYCGQQVIGGTNRQTRPRRKLL